MIRCRPLRRPDVPRELWDVVRACLEKEPAERIPSVGGLARALAPFADDESAELYVRVSRVMGEAEAIVPTQRAADRQVVSVASGYDTRVDSSLETIPAPPMQRLDPRLVIGIVAGVISIVAFGVIVALVKSQNKPADPSSGFAVSVQGSASATSSGANDPSSPGNRTDTEPSTVTTSTSSATVVMPTSNPTTKPKEPTTPTTRPTSRPTQTSGGGSTGFGDRQ
ncbi:MAG: hypothetical protein U0165_17070 [Polyangiaceae bacterium]